MYFQQIQQKKIKTARTDDGNVGCYFSIIDVSSTIYIFIKGQGVKHMRNFLKHFFKDESGMGVVEVILIIVGILTPYYGVSIKCIT